jgi:hypothetical protein
MQEGDETAGQDLKPLTDSLTRGCGTGEARWKPEMAIGFVSWSVRYVVAAETRRRASYLS